MLNYTMVKFAYVLPEFMVFSQLLDSTDHVGWRSQHPHQPEILGLCRRKGCEEPVDELKGLPWSEAAVTKTRRG